MSDNNDMPRTRTIEPMAPPPPSSRPTTAMLKGDIDSGRTGDKVGVFDPGLSPLGTDDEAAGRPPEPHRIALARRMEGVARWAKSAGRKGAGGQAIGDPGLLGFLAMIALVGIALVTGIMMGR